MSTKIYSGYRLAEGTNVFEFCQRLREQADPVRDRLDMETLERLSAAGDPKRSHASRLYDAIEVWRDMQNTIGSERRGNDPHRLEVTFLWDKETQRVLAITYIDTKEIGAVWESQPEVEFYGYWNNSDPDEDCSEQEWAEREAAWRRVMPDYDPPIRCGLSFELRSSPWDGMIDLVLAEAKVT